jgi:hypothetical protein
VTNPTAGTRALPAIRRLGGMVAVGAMVAGFGSACHSSKGSAGAPILDPSTTVTAPATTTTSTTLPAGPVPGNPKGVVANVTGALSDFDSAIAEGQSGLGGSESILPSSAQAVQTAIAARRGIITSLLARVKSSPYLTATDRASLQSTLAQASSGLATASGMVGGTTSSVSSAARFAANLGVETVVQPQVLFTIATEDAQHVAAQYAAIAIPLTTYFTTLSQQGQSVFAVSVDLADIKSDVVDIQTALAGMPATLLAISVGDANGHRTSSNAVKPLTTARTSLGKGLDALNAINQAFP